MAQDGSEDEFYITLTSNVKSLYTNNDNTVANFITPLPHTLHLSGEWEVGLKDVYYTKSWYNVRRSRIRMVVGVKQTFNPSNPFDPDKVRENKKLVDDLLTSFKSEEPDDYSEMRSFAGNGDIKYVMFDGKTKVNNRPIYTTPSLYRDVDKLVKMLNEAMAKLVHVTTPPKLYRMEFTGRIKIEPGLTPDDVPVWPIFAQDIVDILQISDHYKWLSPSFVAGTKESHEFVTKKTAVVGKRIVDITADRNLIYVYSDIVAPSVVGNTFWQLLKIVSIPIFKAFGDTVSESYHTPQYHRVLPSEFNRIEVDLKFDTGERVPFEYGRTCLILHFRKRSL
jgi:hypothetical protein